MGFFGLEIVYRSNDIVLNIVPIDPPITTFYSDLTRVMPLSRPAHCGRMQIYGFGHSGDSASGVNQHWLLLQPMFSLNEVCNGFSVLGYSPGYIDRF